MTIKQGLAAAAVAAAALAVSAGGVLLVKHHEGRPAAGYKDPVGIVTACYGHTKSAVLGKKYTEAECEALLKQDLKTAEAAIKRLVKVPITQDQYDALVSFVFNVGEGAFSKSTLLRKLNAGDCWGAAAEFSRWNKAKGTELRGLTKRRSDEREIFSKACHVPAKAKLTQTYASPYAPPKDVPTGRRAPDAKFFRREVVGSV